MYCKIGVAMTNEERGGKIGTASDWGLETVSANPLFFHSSRNNNGAHKYYWQYSSKPLPEIYPDSRDVPSKNGMVDAP